MKKLNLAGLLMAMLFITNCEALKDALGGLVDIGAGIKGVVTDTKGKPVEGALIEVWKIGTATAKAVKAQSTVLSIDELKKIEATDAVDTDDEGAFRFDLGESEVGAYLVLASANCYATVLKGLRDDRDIVKTVKDAVDAIKAGKAPDNMVLVLNGKKTELEITMAGGCGGSAPSGGGKADTVTAASQTGRAGNGAWTAFTVTTDQGAIDAKSAAQTGTYEDTMIEISGTHKDPVGKTFALVVDVAASGATVLNRTIQRAAADGGNIELRYVVPTGARVILSLAELNANGDPTNQSYAVDLSDGTAGGRDFPAFQVVMSWDNGAPTSSSSGAWCDIDLHVSNITPDKEGEVAWNSSAAFGSLDIDNVWGFGPETITITDATAKVNVSVEAWSCPADLPVNVTVTIIAGGYTGSFSFDDWNDAETHSHLWHMVGTFDKDGPVQ